MNFWIIFGMVGLIAVPLLILFACAGVDSAEKGVGVGLALVFWFVLAGGIYLQNKDNSEQWNNGFCECGQHWELRAVTRTRNGTERKYYVCPDCYIEIEIVD